ncbi:MAG: hypothetical protein RIQ78_961 [Bacteroidota bacterium]
MKNHTNGQLRLGRCLRRPQGETCGEDQCFATVVCPRQVLRVKYHRSLVSSRKKHGVQTWLVWLMNRKYPQKLVIAGWIVTFRTTEAVSSETTKRPFFASQRAT